MPAQITTLPTAQALDKSEHEEEAASEQDEWRDTPADSALITRRVREHVDRVLAFIEGDARGLTFYEFEKALVPLVFCLGRLLVALFLCRRHEELATSASVTLHGQRYQRKEPKSRLFGTFFGKVRYWRTYMHAPGGGFHPLDRALRMPKDGFSHLLVSLMARLATKMSYAQVTGILELFLRWSPSQTTVEDAVLGLGRRTETWFEQAPVPEHDGEVLVIQIDSKATPTATEEELAKRRGPRDPQRIQDSPRHRGRQKRERNGPPKRRAKGDHSKNGRAAHLVVMYSLRHGEDAKGRPLLKGPVNRRVYASYAPKRHAFAIARREADQRGFTQDAGKTIQLVTDGDEDLAHYKAEFLPEAQHTLDVHHAMEYVYDAGQSFYPEGSKELHDWADRQRDRLYGGYGADMLKEIRSKLAAIPKTGPGTKGKRERAETAVNYLAKRQPMMNYDELIAQDLEIGSGAVEGAVRYVIGQRFDCAGMRWVRESSEPLLQLRCIEINGQWEEFMEFVHATGTGSIHAPPGGVPLLAREPGPLPTLGVAA